MQMRLITIIITIASLSFLVIFIPPTPFTQSSGVMSSIPSNNAEPPSTVVERPYSLLKQLEDKLHPDRRIGFEQMPLVFIENRGQLDDETAYYIQGRDKSLYFSSDGVEIVLTNAETTAARSILNAAAQGPVETMNDEWHIHLEFVGANPNVQPIGQTQAETIISYLKGNPEQHRTGIPTYSELIYPNLWPGIDLIFRGTATQLKYDFVVRSGADPHQIRLAYHNVTAVSINSAGQLEIVTPLGNFHDEMPFAYQETEGQRVPVEVTYNLIEQAGATYHYGFDLGNYDPDQTLIIDPAVIIFSGFIGGSHIDYGMGLAIDHEEYVYVAGRMQYNTSNPDTDTFVAKVKPDGTELVYLTYFGGSEPDRVTDIALDGDGYIYITGSTQSSSIDGFPTKGGLDSILGGFHDAFVAKLSPDATEVVYSGYIGGGGYDEASGLAIDDDQNVYIVGHTDGIPVLVGPDLTFNDTYTGKDVFVAKVKADGSGLAYAGYVGGAHDEKSKGIAVDSAGHAYITGYTYSDETSFPVTVGPDLTANGGRDAFIAKVKPDGSGLVYAGYIGGAKEDRGNAIAVDKDGYAYITGFTYSDAETFPVKTGPDLTFNGGYYDAFVAKIETDGTELVYAGYLGGNNQEDGIGIDVDNLNHAYITGFTQSPNFPVQGGPIIPLPKGSRDIFLLKLETNGSGFIFSRLFGARTGLVADITVDDKGSIYLVGSVDPSTNEFPTKGGPDLTGNGYDDAFVAKITEQMLTIRKHAPETVPPGEPFTYTLTISNTGSLTVTNVVITDSLPVGANYVSGGTRIGDVVSWTLPALTIGEQAEFSYMVSATETVVNDSYHVRADAGQHTAGQEPVVTAIGSSLDVFKEGPALVGYGNPITYTIFAYNYGPGIATEVVITDVIPLGATYLEGGNRVDDVVEWSIPSLPIYSYTQVQFAVTANQTITNSNYGVRAKGGYAAIGPVSVVTIVTGTGRITGLVTAADSGTPLGNILVETFQDMGESWQPVGFTTTAPSGQYLLDNLPPGTYRVSFSDPTWAYWPQYYQATDVISTANNISVTAYLTTPNINAALEPTEPPLVEVEGSVNTWHDPQTGEVKVTAWRNSQMTISRSPSCPADLPIENVNLIIGPYTFAMLEDLTDSNLYSVTLTIPDDLPSQGIYQMKTKWECAGQAQYQIVGEVIVRLYDPSGQVANKVSGEPIKGATVSLYRVPNALPDVSDQQQRDCRTTETRDGDNWDNEPPASLEAGVFADSEIFQINGTPEFSPTINPQITASDGNYAWDVAEGCWYVVVEAPDFNTKISPIVGVPPAVTDLHLMLSPVFDPETKQTMIYLPIIFK